jgi:beta-glucosidase
MESDMEAKIEHLLARMTLEEKVSMLAGADSWTTVSIERLGIPAIKVTDGPIGPRGAYGNMGPTSACFPAGVALAATWNPDLVERVGMALGEEVKAKGAHILLAPTVNIHRSPLAGRNFECYSEDPYLSGRMAVAYIRGLQSQGVGACIKHFVCNDSEFERRTISSEVAERPLREIYLAPFRMAVREAKPWAVMSAYNKINGTYASENPYLLLGILKGEWGFDGIVMSDWGGTYGPGAAAGGLDLEMPGPARWMGIGVLEAVRAGELGEDVVDDKVRRLLRVILRSGAFETPELEPERSVDKPEHHAVARQAAAEAAVLLKNDGGLLPLDPVKLGSIAVIGENARWAQIQGGGSTQVTPHYVVSPLDGILNRAGDAVEVGYEIGCLMHRSLPPLDASWLTTPDGAQRGFAVHFYDNDDLSGEPVHVTFTDRTQINWNDRLLGKMAPGKFSARLTGMLAVPEGGTYLLGLESAALSRLYLDGVERIDNWSQRPAALDPWDAAKGTAEVELAAGQSYQLEIEYSARVRTFDWMPLRIGCMPKPSSHPIDDAAALAARSDVAVVFAGLTSEWESEGFDRPDMELPGDQAKLIEQVAAANPNTIVVLNAGSPLNLHWLDKVAAVVQAWYLGQETGNAIADVLFGDVNPSGKLPTTFPKRLQDNPAYLNYPGENGQVLYGEGLFVGYRYYEKKDIAPLFPFGHGLSYTTFAYRNLTLDAATVGPGDEIRVGVHVQNTGARAGQEVVQLYVRDVECSLMRPEKELKAFAKVALQPGETRTVTFTLTREALSFYDPAGRGWTAEPGDFEALIGSSSRDIHLVGRFVLEGEAPPEAREDARLHVGLALRTVLDDPEGRVVLQQYLGAFLQGPEVEALLDLSLEQVAGHLPTVLTAESLQKLDEDLAAV